MPAGVGEYNISKLGIPLDMIHGVYLHSLESRTITEFAFVLGLKDANEHERLTGTAPRGGLGVSLFSKI